MASSQFERIPTTASLADRPGLRERMQHIWETKPGVIGWLSTVDHKEIGIRYLVTSFAFLVLGGLEALTMRLQLAGPDLRLLTPEQYNELFTTHGFTMIFLYALPVLSGFSNYMWPLLFGSRDMAFPRLNALSYWIFLFSGVFLYVSFFLGVAPNDGWFNYVPYASRTYNPGPNIDFYAVGMVFFGLSTTAGAVNFVVTFLRCRAPGMSINRVPVVTWGTVTASAANILAVPVVSLAFFLLWMDRNFGTHFFDPGEGGEPLLWQHLFWMFAHPWVYVIVLPAMGFVSDGLPVFCRRPLVGYTPVVLGTITTMMLGFGVWVHHMFATGLPPMALSFFGAASTIIAVPSAIAVFAWIATIWTGRPVFTTAFLFFASFVFLFVIGGVSGFMTGSIPVDWQLTDTYFIVAHIHYVLIGINVFPVVGALYYWFPKMTGRMLDEGLGKWNFWLMFVGFNLGFFPMHISGLLGMPRRIYTYPAGLGWDIPNLVTTIGAFLFAVGVLLLFVNVIVSVKGGRIAGDNPWDAPTLEWSVPSPPPPYNFAVIPIVASRHPLWEDRLAESPERSSVGRGLVLDHGKEMVGVGMLDGDTDVILKMPDDSIVPLLLTMAMTALFAGALIHWWWLAAAGGIACVLVSYAWLWPRREIGQTARPAPSEEEDRPPRPGRPWLEVLPVGSMDYHASGFWGMLCLILTEGALFAYLLFSYGYVAVRGHEAWPPSGLPKFDISAPNTAILILSSVAVWWGESGARHRRQRGRTLAGLGIGFVLGLIFIALQFLEWHDKPFSLHSDPFGSLFFTITGFHMAHVAAGVLVLLGLLVWTALGKFSAERHAPITIGALYWHFVDVVWLTVFFTLYITPYFG